MIYIWSVKDILKVAHVIFWSWYHCWVLSDESELPNEVLNTERKDLNIVETLEWMKLQYLFEESGWKMVTDWGGDIWKGDHESDM